MKSRFQTILYLICSLAILNFAAAAQISSGGNYAVEKKAVAGGGGESNDNSGMIYKIEGTIGQNAAGTPMSGGNYSQIGGFWTPQQFAPTAAGLTISGRVVIGNKEQKQEKGLSDAVITLSGGLMTAPRIVRTNSFGFFALEEVEAGYFYVIRVHHRRYEFVQSEFPITLMEDLTNLVFRAGEEKF